MTKNYAVVDLETTAPSKKNGRIIQIGIVLVENDQIIDHFSSLVNPDQTIPEVITQLTKITNQQVKKAPYFEELAPVILNLLQDHVFVAHNVEFDFNFLNQELAAAGLPKLKNIAYDTVELVKIFFPHFSSFKLEDLAPKLGLVHDQPHQALSDAYSTALLLLKIKEKIDTIPSLTMQKILSISSNLVADNGFFLQEQFAKRAWQIAPNAQQWVVDDFILRRSAEFISSSKETKKYPLTQKGKEKCFLQAISLNSDQNKTANLIYRFLANSDSDQKNLVIPTNQETNCSFVYLFPISFLANLQQKIMIAYHTDEYSSYLVEEIADFNNLSNQKLQVARIKAFDHYLNLAAFAKTFTLEEKERNSFATYQASILVWLLDSATGDLDEYPQKKDDHPFFKIICNHDQKETDYFLNERDLSIKQSNLLLIEQKLLFNLLINPGLI